MLNIAAGAPASTGYNLTRSLRFRASASAYLSRTPASAGNRSIWTWSGWVKRGKLGTIQGIFGTGNTSAGGPGATFITGFVFNNSDQLLLYWGGSGAGTSTAVFRDPSAWYHLVVVANTTTLTAYINGVSVLSGAISGSGAINDTQFTTLGGFWDTAGGIPLWSNDIYMTEVNFIDGQALTPSSFGSTNALTGVWQPAAYTGSYGTNGFYLPFTDNSTAAALGTDFSGNSNTWTVNNISVTAGVTYDSMTDVPTLTNATTANFCTLNPLINTSVSGFALTNGNLTFATTSTTSAGITFNIPTTGKWYWEGTLTALSVGVNLGIYDTTYQLVPSADPAFATVFGYGYGNSGNKLNNGTAAYGASFTTNDVIGVAFDADAGTLTFYKNNASQGTAFTGLTGKVYSAYFAANSSTWVANFGQRPFAYTPPTGFVALNTFNLPASTIVKGNTVMDATLYTGTGAALSVTNAAGFQPDLVWVKSRSNATDHRLTDSVRGVTLSLATNSTNNEVTNVQGVTAFNSNGFTLGTDADYNGSARTFVGWQWKAGQGSTSSNTSGTITSTVSVDASAGFSIATFTTPGGYTNATIGHGLGVAPAMYIVKNRSGSVINWITYHKSLGNTQALYMNGTNAAVTSSTFWNNTSPTSSVFSIGSNLFASQTYVAYCWSEIDGFSKFGSYTGNGSADGPFVYTGFRPKFVMLKRINDISNWGMRDTSRSPINVTTTDLWANLFDAESAAQASIDLLSNGFKLREAGGGATNASGSTYIYMAFAENPTKYALAR